ncbi:MAG: hypothetical protein GXX96_23540 [Planctomycetaceae bacterium]|jgi:hypothetical protein|nr:hypothetical protein [Planctomycetaceae bacterium]
MSPTELHQSPSTDQMPVDPASQVSPLNEAQEAFARIVGQTLADAWRRRLQTDQRESSES